MRRSTPLRAATATSVSATLAVTLAAFVGLAGLVGCGGAEIVTASRSPQPIHLGAIYSLAGAQASLDGPSLDGARLAVDRINAAGGLLGRRVELLERDGQSSAGVVRYDAQTLVAAHVSAMIGLSDSTLVMAAAPVAAGAGIPFVTSGATSPQLPAQVPGWLFLACFGDNVQAAAAAEYAITELGARRIAVLYDKDMEYTRLLKRYFTESVKAYGGTIVFVRAFHTGERDVGKIMAPGGATTDPDDVGALPLRAHLIYVAAGPEDAGPLVRKLRAAGYGQPIMGGDSYDTQRLLSAAEQTGGGVYYTTHAALGYSHGTAAMRRFYDLYAAAYGRVPENSFAALGFDTVDLVAKAIVRARSSDPAKVRDALLQMRSFRGVTGELSYDGDTFVPRKQVAVIAVGSRPVLAADFAPIYVPKP